MGTIRKKKPDALTRMSGFLSIASEPFLYGNEAEARRVVAELEKGESGPDAWKYEVCLVNPDRGLWEIRMTDETGFSQRVSF